VIPPGPAAIPFMKLRPLLLVTLFASAGLASIGFAQPAGLQKQDVALPPPKPLKTKLPSGYTIPTVDLTGETHRQVIVDREAGQYLGHPTTVLLEDGETMLTVYPRGHGRGSIIYKRSEDGGRTWSGRLPTPKSWETSLEVPTLHRVVDATGRKRLIMFSGLYPVRMAVSEDDGLHWSELKSIGDFGGIVTMATVIDLKFPGHYLAFFHDDGRFIRGGDVQANTVKSLHSDQVSTAAQPWRFWVYTTLSKDGGLTWSVPVPIAMRPDADLCEPGALRSPDGRQIAVLLRENSRTYNSFVIFSNDEGLTWTEPRELPAALTGDRHVAKYAPDGRLFISFRDMTHGSPNRGDWAGWVGTYDDIVKGSEGQYRVRIMDNTRRADSTYPGVELLPDGTFVTTTYGHWTQGEEPYIVSVRFKLAELDARAKR
jgi:BNR repeat-like domain